MTKGSNLPFRRLCREFGADVTVGEMAVAKKIVQRRRGELALLRVHPDDHPFGAQLADRNPETLAKAAAVAEERGADFIDLNCGCPIDHFTRKGLGSRLLERPRRLGVLIKAMCDAVDVPITVKIRLGWNERQVNFLEVARVAQEEGAAAISMHGRTREQRYTRAADWDAIAELKQAVSIPVIGNGDLLTYWEFHDRWERAGCDALMTARGALVKPWIFQEVKERRTIHKTAPERMVMLRRYVELATEHFGDDDYARERIFEFLVWHLGFFCRYRHLPREEFETAAFEHPLLQTRHGATVTGDPLEDLMQRADAPAHEHLARVALGELDEDAPSPPAPVETDDPRGGDAVLATSNG